MAYGVVVTSPSPKSLVIVEDEEDISATLREVFEDEGYTVYVAADGRRALTLLRSLADKPCLILLDLVMPEMDGNQLHEELQRDAALRDIPVVITTSDPSRAPSGVMIMRKPIRLALLIDTVRKWC